MIPHILGSKPVVEAMEADLKPRVELLRQQGIVPKLAIVRVGANPDDLSYERMAIKRAESLDIAVQGFDYPENVDPELVAGDIRYINEDASIHGCLMFRPLPEYMDEQALCNMLVPHKDVDGISVAALPGGQRQRAWIAMALAQDTGLILLDEPTTYLDMAHQLEVLELLQTLNRDQGKTIALVIHELNLAARFSNWMIALKAGAIRGAGTPAEVMTPALLREVFGLDALIEPDPWTGRPSLVSYRLAGEE